MAQLTAQMRRELPKSKFLVPSKAPGPGSYPVPDKAHERAAIGLAAMHHGHAAGERIKTKLRARGSKLKMSSLLHR